VCGNRRSASERRLVNGTVLAGVKYGCGRLSSGQHNAGKYRRNGREGGGTLNIPWRGH